MFSLRILINQLQLVIFILRIGIFVAGLCIHDLYTMQQLMTSNNSCHTSECSQAVSYIAASSRIIQIASVCNTRSKYMELIV